MCKEKDSCHEPKIIKTKFIRSSIFNPLKVEII